MMNKDKDTFTSDTTGAIHALCVIAPIQVGNLEQSMIERAIRVERADGRRVEITFPAHKANPCVHQCNGNRQRAIK